MKAMSFQATKMCPPMMKMTIKKKRGPGNAERPQAEVKFFAVFESTPMDSLAYFFYKPASSSLTHIHVN